MENALMVWKQRLVEELARGTDLLCLDVLGTQFTVRWGRAVTWQQRENMSSAWARCASSSEPLLPPLPVEPTESQPFTASVTYKAVKDDDGMFHLRAASFEELAENLTSRLTLAAILANAGELTMLHACGVADPATGAVVALVARSGTGKTTAASVLARRYGYVSDETVAIRPDGSVVPYPKPLSMKQGLGEPKRQVGPDELGLQSTHAKSLIQSIVLLERVHSGHPLAPVLSKVPLADAVLALIPDSSSQGEVVEPLQSLCRLIDSVGGVWRVTYTEAADLPAALEPLFRTHVRRQSEAEAEPEWAAAAAGDTQQGPIPDGLIRRAAAKDAVAIGDDLLVMLDSQIVQLNGIGPAIWEASAMPVRPDQLADAIGRMHGTPDGYQEAVAAATQQLVMNEVLEQQNK